MAMQEVAASHDAHILYGFGGDATRRRRYDVNAFSMIEAFHATVS